MSYEEFRVVAGKLQRFDGRSKKWREIKCVSNHHDGYCLVKVRDKQEAYHRILWTIVNGAIPAGLQLDHINGDRIDNRLENLRLVTNRGNGQNRHEHREGKLVGVSFHKGSKKWQANIHINKKQIYLGLYSSEQKAHEAYIKTLKEILARDVCC